MTIAASIWAGDFRNAKWGMTQAQVAGSESTPPKPVRMGESQTALHLESTVVEGLQAGVFYVFQNDRLVRAKYVFLADHADLNEYVADFKRIEQDWMDKFGQPSNTRAVWENPAYQDESPAYLEKDRATPAEIFASDEFIGKEILLGHLRLLTEWTSGRTKILHVLTGDTSRITHQVEYSSAD
jgi:hypothetical protein